ncbi:MAG: DUF4837 family protein [Bacteroidales bacterium]|nr:DUF4837 family protein [Bacteroidales bacterium]
MGRILKSLILAALAVLAISSCTTSQKRRVLMQNISGKAGEVIVVINGTDWNGPLGTELRDNLGAACSYLPNKEPLYALVNVPPTAFTNLFKLHRNIIYFNVNGEVKKEGVEYMKDVWAQPQCVMRINAKTPEGALEALRTDMNRIFSTLEVAERNRIISNAKHYEETGVRPAVADIFGGSPYFPSGFTLKKRTADFAWVSYETTPVQQGIFVWRYPTDGLVDPFSLESLVSKRNEVLQANVPGMYDGTYMTTATSSMEPEIDYIRYKDFHFAEIRGWWEVYNDFMGGPFFSHSFYSPDGKYIVTVDGYVYAPKYDKRQYLRQVEALVYSFEWSQPKKD